MVEHKSLLAKAFILTALIFVIGVILGFYLDSLRSDEALFNLRNSELDAQSYLSEQEFFEEFGGYDCTIAGKRIDDLSKQLGELGPYIVNFERKNLFKQEDYEYLLRKYFLMEVRTYTQFTKLNRECGLNKTLILYFFDPEDSVSERQGKILDVLVRESIGLSVFSINFRRPVSSAFSTISCFSTLTSVTFKPNFEISALDISLIKCIPIVYLYNIFKFKTLYVI